MLVAVTPVRSLLAPRCGSVGRRVCGNGNGNTALPAVHGLWWWGNGTRNR